MQRVPGRSSKVAGFCAGFAGTGEGEYPGLPDDPSHARMLAFMDGPSGVLAFEPSGGAKRAEALCHATELFTHATSFGGVESTLERRGRWPDESEIPPALVRVNVGCEHVEDLWDDLQRALQQSRAPVTRSL